MIDKLEFILALSRERHFGRAADACGVTQPTLSAGLKQLEETLGVRLVDRGSRFQGFTPEGERVLDWARRIVGDSRALLQEIASLKEGLVGHIRISVIPTAIPILTSLTTPFRARHPGVRFTVMSRASVSILTQIENLDVDAGITYLDNEPLGRVRSLPLYREEYLLLTEKDGPLGDHTQATWAEAGQLPLCLLSPDMQNRRIIDDLLLKAGAPVSPGLESDSLTALVAHVRTGRWSTIVPRQFAGMFELSKVKVLPLVEPEVTHTIGLVVVERDPLPPLIAALLNEARHLGLPLLASHGGGQF